MALKDGHPDAHLWMQAAVPKSRKGLFTAKAKKAGKSVAAYAQAKASAPGRLGKEARFALIAKKISRAT